MENVIAFPQRATVARLPAPPSPAETRRMIEEAAQTALDTADGLLAILDRMESDPDAEGGVDEEPAVAAPEIHHGSQVVRLHRNDRSPEAETAASVFPAVVASPVPRFRLTDDASFPLAWGGHGNVVAAAGVALLNMVGGR